MTHVPVPLTIIGGFLGSGKTSLLNHILSRSEGRRIAVLVNDFGAINIDARQIVAIEGETISLANGCVCCTIRDDLLTEVLKLLESKEPPEHIVIETSGVSKPVAVVETFMSVSVQGLVEVQNLIAVLDADLVVDEDAGYGDLAFDQITVADLVVVNKTDLVAPARRQALRQRVEALVPRARIWETSFGEVPLELIFEHPASQALNRLSRTGAGTGHAHRHEHGVDFDAWSYASDRAWSFGALQRAVDTLPRGIYRAKGTVRLDLPTNDYGVLQLTGRRAWLRLCEPDAPTVGASACAAPETELVFIGSPGAIDNDSLRQHFERAHADAANAGSAGYIVTDLRAFNVIFA